MTTTRSSSSSPDPAQSPLRIAQLVAGSLIAGVTTFALVATLVVARNGATGDPEAAPAFFYAWAAIAFGALVAAMVLWRMNVAPRIERSRSAAAPDATDNQTLLNGLIVVWALMEGPSLFALVLYLLFATPAALAAGLLMAWLGIGLTFPRTDWFPAAERRQ